jgi:hypothetical protein
MSTQSSAHFFLNWVKERIDEMDATIASLESKAAEMGAEARVKADQFIGDLCKKRNEFESTVKKQAEAGEAAREAMKARLETQWTGFESELRKYLEAFGKDIKQQQVVFQSQVTAQMQAWREAADKIHAAAGEFAAGHRKEVDATVSRMRADAATAEAKLQKLAQAGTESWSALSAALTETRAAFDRANQAAGEAFKRATGPAQ